MARIDGVEVRDWGGAAWDLGGEEVGYCGFGAD